MFEKDAVLLPVPLHFHEFLSLTSASSLRLAGTKVVMTSGGFVQVRSDKGKPAVVSTRNINDNAALAAEQVSCRTTAFL